MMQLDPAKEVSIEEIIGEGSCFQGKSDTFRKLNLWRNR